MKLTDSHRFYLVGYADGGSPMKVGVTHAVHLGRRVGQLRRARPGTSGSVLMPDGIDQSRLTLVASAPGERSMDRRMKIFLQSRQVRGEWFDMGPDPVDLLTAAATWARSGDRSTAGLSSENATEIREGGGHGG